MWTGSPILPATASWVLRPFPVTQMTSDSFRPIFPAWASFRATATVTPPAVSVKIPSVRANSLIASTISSSVTASASPPDALSMSIA